MTKVIDQSPIIVHKEGEEGALTIDRLNGRITTPHEERPDWAEGFAVAMLAERTDFYSKRLGEGTPQFIAINEAQAIEVSDLSWVGVNADGDEIEVEAEAETRMNMLSAALGMDRDSGELSGTVLAEREIERQPQVVTAEEVKAMEQSVDAGFGTTVTNVQGQKAAGTK